MVLGTGVVMRHNYVLMSSGICEFGFSFQYMGITSLRCLLYFIKAAVLVQTVRTRKHIHANVFWTDVLSSVQRWIWSSLVHGIPTSSFGIPEAHVRLAPSSSPTKWVGDLWNGKLVQRYFTYVWNYCAIHFNSFVYCCTLSFCSQLWIDHVPYTSHTPLDHPENFQV